MTTYSYQHFSRVVVLFTDYTARIKTEVSKFKTVKMLYTLFIRYTKRVVTLPSFRLNLGYTYVFISTLVISAKKSDKSQIPPYCLHTHQNKKKLSVPVQLQNCINWDCPRETQSEPSRIVPARWTGPTRGWRSPDSSLGKAPDSCFEFPWHNFRPLQRENAESC